MCAVDLCFFVVCSVGGGGNVGIHLDFLGECDNFVLILRIYIKIFNLLLRVL